MPIVLGPLERAAASLARALAQPRDEFSRDASIQRFEYTYELAWKAIRRALLNELGLVDVEGASRRELYRMAAQQRLVPDPAPWFGFHDARNRTSHTYNEATAEEVYVVAGEFLPAVQALLAALERYRE